MTVRFVGIPSLDESALGAMSRAMARRGRRTLAAIVGASSYLVVYRLHEYGGLRFVAMVMLAAVLSFAYASLLVRRE